MPRRLAGVVLRDPTRSNTPAVILPVRSNGGGLRGVVTGGGGDAGAATAPRVAETTVKLQLLLLLE